MTDKAYTLRITRNGTKLATEDFAAKITASQRSEVQAWLAGGSSPSLYFTLPVAAREPAEPAPTPESEAPRPNWLESQVLDLIFNDDTCGEESAFIPLTRRIIALVRGAVSVTQPEEVMPSASANKRGTFSASVPSVASVTEGAVPPGEAERLATWLENFTELKWHNPREVVEETIKAATLLRSQERELAIRDAEITEWDTLTTTQIREIAELSRELEEAKAERDVAFEAGQVRASTQVAELSRQLEEARTQTERLQRHLQWAKNPHHANCRCSTLSDTGNCSCGLSGLLEVSG